jgi:hypothetical protein
MEKHQGVHTVFTLAGWDEKPYEEADGVKLTKARFQKKYSGEIEGNSVTESLMVYRPDGTASFVGHERLAGTVRGKRGTFVIQFVGEFRNGVADSRGVIVKGAGTGDLSQVTGEVPYKSGSAKEYPMVFRLNLS